MLCFWVEIIVLLIVGGIAYISVACSLGKVKANRKFRFTLRALFVFLCFAGVMSFFAKWLYDHRTPRSVVRRTEYPCDVDAFLEEAEAQQIEVEDVKVHIGSLGLIDEYSWQAKASPELLDFSVSRMKLVPVDEKEELVKLFWIRMPDSWKVSRSDEADYYNSRFPGAGYGITLMHDKKGQRLYYWYMYGS